MIRSWLSTIKRGGGGVPRKQRLKSCSTTPQLTATPHNQFHTSLYPVQLNRDQREAAAAKQRKRRLRQVQRLLHVAATQVPALTFALATPSAYGRL
jgi:hypothetical protein